MKAYLGDNKAGKDTMGDSDNQRLVEEYRKALQLDNESRARLPNVRSSTTSRGGEVILEPMTQTSASGALAERIGRLLGRIKSFPEASGPFEEELGPLMALARSQGLETNYSPLANMIRRAPGGGGRTVQTTSGGSVAGGIQPRMPIESAADYAAAHKDPYEELRNKILQQRMELADRGPGFLQELLRRFRRG